LKSLTSEKIICSDEGIGGKEIRRTRDGEREKDAEKAVFVFQRYGEMKTTNPKKKPGEPHLGHMPKSLAPKSERRGFETSRAKIRRIARRRKEKGKGSKGCPTGRTFGELNPRPWA